MDNLKEKQLEDFECEHETLNKYDKLQVVCDNCGQLFLLTPSPF